MEARVKRLLAALSALMLLAVPAAGDWCQWEEQGGQLVFVCYPEYYVTMYNQPDWCLYAPGDEVIVTFGGDPLVPIAWYVTPESDPGRDGDWVVVHDASGCYIVAYPW